MRASHAAQGLQRGDGEWVELTNGCMCCAVKSDFLQALESLLDRPGGRRFDYILIETTGLANPGPIATALWTDAELESRVSLDGVVTVVDAVNIDRQLHEPRTRGAVNEAQVQVAYADIVILNKVGVVTGAGAGACGVGKDVNAVGAPSLSGGGAPLGREGSSYCGYQRELLAGRDMSDVGPWGRELCWWAPMG
jgi:G3E family GTPase